MEVDFLNEGQIQSLFFEFLSEKFKGNDFQLANEFPNKNKINSDENECKENVDVNINSDYTLNKSIEDSNVHIVSRKENDEFICKIKDICYKYDYEYKSNLNNTNELTLMDDGKYYLNFSIWESEIVVGILGLSKFCSMTLYNMTINDIMVDEYNYNIGCNDIIVLNLENVYDLLCTKLEFIEKDTYLNYFKLFSYLSESNTYIFPNGFRPVMKEITNRHKALNFLRGNNIIFTDLFIDTIISRIYYELDIIELKKLRYKDIKNSNLFYLLDNLKGEESFEDLVHYFSYQHFYVLYYRFIELDTDEDQELSFSEFRNHDNSSITEYAANRIWKCNIQNKSSLFDKNNTISRDRKMDYFDFLFFYISDEDKTSDRSIRYWFEIIDLDCDGWLSKEEIETFYVEQRKRIHDLEYSIPEFDSILCMMNDLLMPTVENKFRLDDFIRNKLVAGHFFNILVNTKKCITTILMDGEFNTIHSSLQSKKCNKYISPWDLHCYYQYQIIQGSNNEESFQQN